eukprot:TRINITY_DN2079_c0_g1_i1.p1 TRINITY_DN2079_c0_g1~~TRINITY_DN2079_c0_g1_i1.p1  ORF type:complete len:121 (-),score=7.34 TRINITY_DN2079_c0_g1_i1:28-390(-)
MVEDKSFVFVSSSNSFTLIDPFSDSFGDKENVQSNSVHIRIFQRNARKRITNIEGLSEKLDLNRILKTLRKQLCCNGCLLEDDPDRGIMIQLQGEHRQEVASFLVSEEICEKNQIVIHGY